MMLSFKTFTLSESTKEESVKVLLDFEKFSKHIKSNSYKEKFSNALNFFAKNYPLDDIYKSEFADNNNLINRGAEYAYESLRDIHRDEMKKLVEVDPKADSDLWGFSMISAKKMQKISEKYPSYIPSDVKEFLDLALKVKDLMAVIKATAKSSSRKKAEKEEQKSNPSSQFYKPMPSTDAINKANSFVRESVKDFEQELKKVNREAVIKAKTDIESSKDIQALKKVISVGKPAAVFGKFYYISRKDNELFSTKSGKEVTTDDLNKFADEMTKDIIEGYVSKNVGKLSLIFQKKSGIKSHKLISSKVSSAGLVDSVMSIEFDDNSRFTIYSSTEVSYSVNQKPFYRYPTRFTNVFKSDGSKMSQPSEAKMIKEF